MQQNEYRAREQAALNEHRSNNDPRERVQEPGHEYPLYAKLQPGLSKRRPWYTALFCVIALSIAVGIVLLTGGISIGSESQTVPARAFSLSGHGSLVVNEDSGSVHVHAGNTNQIIVQATKHVQWGTGSLNNLQVQYVQQGNTLTVTTSENSSLLFSDLWIDLDITVPVNIDLTIQGNSTDASLAGINGRIDSQIGSGDLTLDHVKGSFDLNTNSGDISVTNESGSLDAHTSSGDIQVDQAATTMNLFTSSGDISVTNAQLAGQDHFQTSSGNIEFSGTLDPHGTYQMEAVSGDITLTLPTNTSFQLNASTNVGNVSNAFSASSTTDNFPHSSVTLKTVTGNITVNKS
jgi:hypothetical protein